MAKLSATTVLGWALQIETSGAAFYREAAARATDRDVKLLFSDLAEQEQRHYRTFERMLANVPASVEADVDPAEYEAYLRLALRDALLAGPEKGLQLARQAQDEEAALRAAITFEKDTLLFFHDLVGMEPEAHRPALEAVMDEESAHLHGLVRVLRDRPWVS